MPKFCTMRVTVPVDDALPVGAVHAHLQRLLEERATERVEFTPEPADGEAPPLPNTPATHGGRVHWTAVEVVQAVERLAAKKAAAAPKR